MAIQHQIRGSMLAFLVTIRQVDGIWNSLPDRKMWNESGIISNYPEVC